MNEKKRLSVYIADSKVQVFKSYLEEKGYFVESERNSYIAVSELRRNRKDILLLEYSMEPLNGLEVIERVREFDKDIQIILIKEKEDDIKAEKLEGYEIYGIYEKGEPFDKLLLMVEGCVKIIRMQEKISELENKGDMFFEKVKGVYDNKGGEKIRTSGKASENSSLFKAYRGSVNEAGDILLEEALNHLNEKLSGSIKENEESYLETIKALKTAVEIKDKYTKGHSDRVSLIAGLIAEEMKFDSEGIQRVTLAGSFHDVGKIGISDTILLKKGRLTDEEFEKIKEHPVLGRKLLSGVRRFNDILDIVESHHERYDGKGYPNGLKGEEIPLEARIIAVADSFDAMTSKRAYRDGMPFENAVNELIRGKSSQFDGEVVEAFIKAVPEERLEEILK